MENPENELLSTTNIAKKLFSKIGFILSAVFVIMAVLQMAWVAIGKENWMTTSSLGGWLGSFLPIYLVAVPVGLFLFKRVEADPVTQTKLGGKDFTIYLLMCFPLMYIGNIIGTVLSVLLSGGQAQNAIMELASDTNWLKPIIMAVVAPIIEEYVFRKQIIDRTKRYGERTAVFLSAFTFALFHGNLFQFFYAFGLGLLFAYVYLKTGRLRYPIIFHCIINFMGSVVAPWILSNVDMTTISQIDASNIAALDESVIAGLAMYGLYVIFLLALVIAGLVLLIVRRKKFPFALAEKELPKGQKFFTTYANPGMITYIVLCTILIVISLLT